MLPGLLILLVIAAVGGALYRGFGAKPPVPAIPSAAAFNAYEDIVNQDAWLPTSFEAAKAFYYPNPTRKLPEPTPPWFLQKGTRVLVVSPPTEGLIEVQIGNGRDPGTRGWIPVGWLKHSP